MQGKDRKKFVEIMTLLGEAFDKPASKEKLEIYYRALHDLSIEDFDQACINVLNTKKISAFPLISEIRDAITGNNGIKAWLLAREAVKKHGAYMSVMFPDPVIHSVIEAMGGWQSFCYISDNEKPFKQKEFERLYGIVREKHKHSQKCIGLHEINNLRTGYKNIDNTVEIQGEEKKRIEQGKKLKEIMLKT